MSGFSEDPELTVIASGKLLLAVTDADTYLLPLRDWLAAEDFLRGRVSLLRPSPEPGHMGALADVLVVALGSGSAGAVLARSLTTWLLQRRADVKVTITAAGGRRVSVDVRRARDVEAVVREIGALLEPSASGEE
ncbi:hypothetical protein AB0469_40245 [Streptomyces sp. NPDC093801]|uniref:effector-associated constant component EACC1 n=1 Tax=Streptomyces sp. NPDC093801 TaxID=3155203 RepID=UPI00344CB5CD